MQASLIRSALIAISNDGNNMDLWVCHPHPSLLLALQPCLKKKKKVQSQSVRGRCDGDEGLTWQVLWAWSGVRVRIGDEEFLRKVRLLTLCTRLSRHALLYISCTTDRSAPKYWHIWVTHMRTPQELRPKVGVRWCYIQYVRVWVETGGYWLSQEGISL